MSTWQAIFLGAIQGITEFLPVSSTAHVMFFSQILNISVPESAFFIFLNLGSLLALMTYYYKDVLKLFIGSFDFILNKKTSERDSVITLFLSSLPVFVIFGTAEIVFDFKIESPFVLASAMIIFAIILYACDRNSTDKINVSRKDSIFTGIAQVASLIPGVSRLGACLSMMRYLGYSRTEAFRYSMILSIPPVVGACFLKLLKIILGKITISNWSLVFAGSVSAFIIGLAALWAVNQFLKRFTLLPLVIYRIIFGIAIFVKIYLS